MSDVSKKLREDYEEYPQIEEAFGEFLDESLNPRGPDSLLDMVASLQLPSGAQILDLGCGAGKQSLELAQRFGFSVTGIDPIQRNIDAATTRAGENADVRDQLRFQLGTANHVSLPDSSVDLIWCREVMCLVNDLEGAFHECARVLRANGRMLLYQMYAADRLEPRELDALCASTDTFPASWQTDAMEEAFTSAAFAIEHQYDFGGEWGEYAEEHRGVGARNLIHAARLLRDPERYIAQFGPRNYQIKLGDTFWHVYRMIGKLSGRAYVLRLS
jgi:SAM-dependent methyltransferase